MEVLLHSTDPDVHTRLRRLLSDRGHDVVLAETEVEAWTAFQEHRPDLVVVASQAGLDLARRMQTARDEVLIVFVCEKRSLEHMHAVFEVGADDCILLTDDTDRLHGRFQFIEQYMAHQPSRMNRLAKGSKAYQQAVVAEIGRRALAGTEQEVLITYSCRVVAQALQAEHCIVLEHNPEDGRFSLKAGTGWDEHEVSVSQLEGRLDGQAHFTLDADGPVRIDDVEQESRFQLPAEMTQWGMRSGISVVIESTPVPYGVLCAYAAGTDWFTTDDAYFLQSVANVLAGAVERSQTQQALQKSEAKARAILESTVEGVITIDDQGRIESFNRAAEEIFGYDAAEVLGENVSVLMPSPEREKHDDYLRMYQEEGRKRIIGIGREVMGQRKDGSTFPMELSVSEFQIGDRQMFAGILRDVTERKEHERRLATQYDISNILAASDTLAEARPQILQTICENLDWDWGEFWRIHAEAGGLRCGDVWCRPDMSLPDFEETTYRTTFAPGEGLLGTVWEQCEPKWITNVTKHDNFVRVQAANEAGLLGAFAFPIQLDGEVLSVMAFFSQEVREPDPQLLRVFSTIGGQIGQFIERRQAEQELRRSATQLARAQEVANLGSWEYHFDTEESVWSDQMYRIFGVDPASFDLSFESMISHLPPKDRKRVGKAVEEARTEGQSFSLEHRVERPDGTERWVISQAEVMRGQDGDSKLIGTVLDITELRKTEEALQESEARAQSILETTVAGIITIDEYGIIESFNQAAEDIFGYDEEEVVGEKVNVLMPPPYRDEHDGYLRSYRETGRRRIIGIGREVTGQRKDGTTFPMELSVSEVDLSDRRLFTGIVRDITERRRLEQKLLDTTERERRRIGQDLHDGLGQMLTGIGLLGQNLTRQLKQKNHPLADDAEEITSLVKEADQYARDLSRGLTPVDLEPSGLSQALQRLTDNAIRLFDVRCTFNEVGTALVHNSTAATHLYRIAQEAVSNAVRHGDASRITITLASGKDQIRLRVRDDGSGFDPQDVNGPGRGVHIMNYRARIIGGMLEINSDRGEGTVVTCTLRRNALADEEHVRLEGSEAS